MDRFARNYLIALLAVLAVAIAAYWLNRDSRVADINAMLAADRELADYPYPFRVLTLENAVATMGTPRSARVPVMRFLRTAYPELSLTSVDHPDMMAAQDRLARTQTRAEQLVTRQADVAAVRWTLDERWFNEHGVFLDLGQ